MSPRSVHLRPVVPERVDLAIQPPTPSDAELVVRARGGDRGAEEVLYRRYARYVGGLAARLLGSQGDAEDILQETFLIAFQQLASLRDDVAFRAWVAQIAVSRVRRRYRRRRLLRLFGLVDDEAGMIELAAPGASSEMLADLALVDAALRRLPGEQRIAWVLRHVEGYALDEVARAIGCSLATAKRRIGAANACVEEHVGGDR